jgi:hypothetical protein
MSQYDSGYSAWIVSRAANFINDGYISTFSLILEGVLFYNLFQSIQHKEIAYFFLRNELLSKKKKKALFFYTEPFWALRFLF